MVFKVKVIEKDIKINSGEKDVMHNIINYWLPEEVKVLGFNFEEREIEIEIPSIESIIDIICDVGCKLTFDVICDEPIIFMELD